MNQRDSQDLVELIDRFICGDGLLKALAADIEGIVVECFQDEPWFDEASEALAMFVPSGTTPYVDERSLSATLRFVAKDVRSRSLAGGSSGSTNQPGTAEGLDST